MREWSQSRSCCSWFLEFWILVCKVAVTRENLFFYTFFPAWGSVTLRIVPNTFETPCSKRRFFRVKDGGCCACVDFIPFFRHVVKVAAAALYTSYQERQNLAFLRKRCAVLYLLLNSHLPLLLGSKDVDKSSGDWGLQGMCHEGKNDRNK